METENIVSKKQIGDMLGLFRNMTYTEQKEFLRKAHPFIKSPPFYIIFNIDNLGLTRLAKITRYCGEREIQFIPEKAKKGRVRFVFPNLSDRNKALIGSLII